MIVSVLCVSLCAARVSHAQRQDQFGAEAIDPETPAEMAKAGSKKELTRVDVGEQLASEGRYDEAMYEFKQAIKENPNDALAHLQLGLLYYYVQKKSRESVDEIRKALEIDHALPDAYYNLGFIYAKSGQYDDAIDLYKRTIEISPKYAEAYLGLGIIYYYYKGMLVEAEELFNKAIKVDPKYAKAHFFLGNVYGGQGKYEDAVKEFRRALEIDPNYGEVHFFLGNILGGQGKLDEAIAEFKQTLALNEQDAEAHYKLGVIYDKKGMTDEAIKEFRTVLRLSPKHVEANNNLGFIFAKKEMFDEAIFEFNKALKINPKYVKVYNNLGIVHAEKGEYQKAIDYFKKAQEISKEDTESLYNLGMTYWKKLKDYDTAVKYFNDYLKVCGHDQMTFEVRKILQLIEQDRMIGKQRNDAMIRQTFKEARQTAKPTGYYGDGVELYKAGNPDKALIEFRKAVEKGQEVADAQMYIGIILSEKEKIKGAIDAFNASLKLKPDNPDVYYNLGLVYDRLMGDVEKAVLNYEAAIDLNKGHFDAYNALGDIYARSGKPDEALEKYQKAVTINPNYAKGYSNIGIVYNAKGRYRDALEQIRKAIALDPKNPLFYNNLASVYMDNKNLEKARETINQALAIEPNSAISHCTAGEIFEQLKDYHQALYHFGKIRKDPKWGPYARKRIRQVKKNQMFNE